jgi:hypothetical protein
MLSMNPLSGISSPSLQAETRSRQCRSNAALLANLNPETVSDAIPLASFPFRPAASKRRRAYHEGGVSQSRKNTASLPLLSHMVAVKDVSPLENTSSKTLPSTVKLTLPCWEFLPLAVVILRPCCLGPLTL